MSCWVTDTESRIIRRLYDSEWSNEEIAGEVGMSIGEFLEACLAVGLPVRPEPDLYMPTPEQIREACAEIRAGWTQAEREDRLRGAWPELG